MPLPTSDEVSSVLLLVGIPACAFLTAYAVAVWFGGTRVPFLLYLGTALAGLTISIGGTVLAAELGSFGPIGDSVAIFGGITLLWPLGCAIVAGTVALTGRLGRLLPIALTAGFLADWIAVVVASLVGPPEPGSVRVEYFLASAGVSVLVAIVAGFRSHSAARRVE